MLTRPDPDLYETRRGLTAIASLSLLPTLFFSALATGFVLAVEFYLLRSDVALLFVLGLALTFVHGAVLMGLALNTLIVIRDWRRVMQGRPPVVLNVDELLKTSSARPLRGWKGKALDFLAFATPFPVLIMFLVSEIINVTQLERTQRAVAEHRTRQQYEATVQKKEASRFVVDQGTRRFFRPTIGTPVGV